MCITKMVYCWHCEQPFEKQNFEPGSTEDFENCPHCGKGFEDLCIVAQKAIRMTLKPLEGVVIV